MSKPPFGFGPPAGEGDENAGESDATGKSGPGGESDPGGRSGAGGEPAGESTGQPSPGSPANPFAMFGQMSPSDVGAAFQRLGQLLSWEGGPVNWDLARDVSRQAVAVQHDRAVGDADRRAVAEAVRLAELWLDPVTALPAGSSTTAAWSRSEWVERTLPAWRTLVEPVAARVVEAMGSTLSAQAPAEMRGMAAPLLQMMGAMGGAMFGAQVGQALGSLATEVVGSTDVGLPLGPAGQAVLLPVNVAVFGEGLGVPAEEVRLFLALREAAHHRLFVHVPWLRAHLVDAVAAYGRGITVDTSRLESAIATIDPTNPEALQSALTGGLFDPVDTPEQKAALSRLETALALVEGWVDEVVTAAAEEHLPAAMALRETVRRRRAAGGPAEQTFGSLVGLELRPRRLRDAAALWHTLLESRGVAGRDAVWSHPDLLPTAADLDDPTTYTVPDTGPLDLSELEDTQAPPEPAPPGADAPDGEQGPAGPDG